MGKIFISAGHSVFEGSFRDLSEGVGGMIEMAELIATRSHGLIQGSLVKM